MSTRCHIRFVFPDGKALTYQHSDGYLTWTIPNIIDFLKWNKGRNAQYDYVVANWFYFNKKQQEHYCDRDYDKDFNKIEVPLKDCYALNFNAPKYANDTNLSTKLGYGLNYNNVMQSDVEYYHEIIFKENVSENAKENIFSHQVEEILTFRIESFRVPYDWVNHTAKYSNPDDLVRYEKPIFVLEISDFSKIHLDTLNKECEKV